jgi:hypothetical protein
MIHAGLQNGSNKCHANAVFQAIAVCPSLTTRIAASNTDTARAFTELHAQMERVSTADPARTFHSMQAETKRRFPDSTYGIRSEDAGETLLTFLNAIDDTALYNAIKYRYRVRMMCDQCNAIVQVSPDESCILSIPYTPDLQTYITKNVSTSEYLCKTCNVPCTQENTLSRAPNVMVVMLNKFKEKKLQQYPQTMSFPPNINYELIAVIDHSGSMEGGHYIARCKKNNGVFIFNDISVSRGNLEPTPESFILFYHRVTTPSPV